MIDVCPEHGPVGIAGYCPHCGRVLHLNIERELDELESLRRRLPEEERRIITPDEFRRGLVADPIDLRLIQYLDAHPHEVLKLTPRRFEELVARLLHQFGYRVRLGPGSKDRGVDVVAERDTDFGPELVLVQCKRYAFENRVGEPFVKQLYADVTKEEATRGLVVTTSAFTSDALKYIEAIRYRVSGADFKMLKEWFTRVRRGMSNL